MDIAKKRLTREIRVVYREKLHEQGIFININPDNEFHIHALIIGPEDTPYQYGFYMFDLLFSKTEYPFVPPKVTYRTQGKGVRFNPNLYTNGKVCVSILGTWNGPQWTSCQSLKSVLFSIQTLLVKNPLQNEPGYETFKDYRHETYENIITFSNYKIAINNMLHQPPEQFECFLPVMHEQFIKNFDKIYQEIIKLQEKNETKKVTCKVYGMRIKIDYGKLATELQDYFNNYNNLLNKEKEINVSKKDISEDILEENGITKDDNVSSELNIEQPDIKIETPAVVKIDTPMVVEDKQMTKKDLLKKIKDEKKTHKRKRPSIKAKEFSDGHVQHIEYSFEKSTLELATKLLKKDYLPENGKETIQWQVYTDKGGSKRWKYL